MLSFFHEKIFTLHYHIEQKMFFGLTIKKIVPSTIVYLALILSTIITDYFLHVADLVWIGRYFGIVGSTLILLSFLYSLRKRKIINSGSAKGLLQAHEVLGWTGALFVSVHGGIHFNAIIPWFALFLMLIVVASGFVGRYLLNASKEELSKARAELLDANLSQAEIEKILLFDSLLVDKMQRWRKIHMPLTTLFLVFALIHIFSILLFW